LHHLIAVTACTLCRKEKEIGALQQNIEEQASEIAALQRKVRELEAKIEELEEDLENERNNRNRVS
jgi:peptidoglycan hydrolase CwlO-like protein